MDANVPDDDVLTTDNRPVVSRAKQWSSRLIWAAVSVGVFGMVGFCVVPNVIICGRGCGKENSTLQNAKMLDVAVLTFYLDNSRYPRSLNDLVTNPGLPNWQGPYVDGGKLLRDSWGNAYQMDIPGSNGHRYDIYSFGADGMHGGDGPNSDIYHWHQ